MAEPEPLPPAESDDAAVYERLISLIENTQGRLAPIIVACDDLKLRQSIITRYEQESRQAQIRPYRIVLEGEPSLRAGLAQLRQDSDYLQSGGAAVFTVTGAETLLRIKLLDTEAQSELEKFFGYLQWTREGLQEFKSPIVLWVPYRIFREMRFRAKDFWSWRKAELRFGAELSAGLVDRAGQRLDQLDQVPPAATDDEFLPPLAELQAEIAQLTTQDQQAPGLALLYDKLGQVYRRRVNRGEAKNLEQERAAAIAAFQHAIARHQSFGDRPAQAASLTQLGNFLGSQSRYKEAIDSHHQSLEIVRKMGDRDGEAVSLGNLGSAYRSLGEYQRAIDFHQQSLEIQRKIGDHYGEAISLGNLGVAYRSLGEYQRAIDFYQQSLEIKREIGDRYGEAISLGNLGLVYYSLGQYQRAIDFYQQSLETKRRIRDREGEAISLSNLGLAYYSLEQYQRAIDFFQQSLEIKRKIGDREGEAISLSGKAMALAQYESRRFEAITTLQQAQEIYAELHLDHKVEECDQQIYAFQRIIATQTPQRAPKIGEATQNPQPIPKLDDPIPRRQRSGKINGFVWGGVGLAIALLVAWLRSR